MPHGVGLSSVLFNLRKAVEFGDADQTAQCLIVLFELFAAVNRPMRVVMTLTRDPGVIDARLKLLPPIGPFSNPNALAMHQMIWFELRTIFLDQVGVGCISAALEMQRLWRNYETFLFCHPYMALASLLAIGQLLCHCYKDGTVLYAFDCWSDTAQDRKWRSDAVAQPAILASMLTRSEHAIMHELLTCDKVYFDNRSRHLKYQQKAVIVPHFEYIMQGKAMTPKNLREFVQRQVLYPGENSGVLVDVVNLIEEWCSFEYAKVNCLYGVRNAEAIQTKCIVLLFLIREIMGIQGALVSSSEDLIASAPIEISPEYARACRLTIQGPLDASDNDRIRFLPKYGLLGDARIGPPRPSTRKKKKKRLSGPSLPLRVFMDIRPEYVPWTHDRLHPGACVNEDQSITPSMASVIRQNRIVSGRFAYIKKAYFTKKNWKRLLGAVKDDTTAPITASIMMDFNLFDFDETQLLFTSPTHNARVFRLLENRPIVNDDVNSEEVLEFLDAEDARFFVQGFSDNYTAEYHRQKAVVFGPYPVSEEPVLRESVVRTAEVRRKLGVHSMQMDVLRLMLYKYPIPCKTSGDNLLRVGRTGVFVVQVPHQRTGICLRVGELHAKMTREGLKGHFYKICQARRLIPVLALLESVAHTGTGIRVDDSFITFDLKALGNKVRVSNIRISAVVDDLGVGEALVRAGDTLSSLREYIDAFESLFINPTNRQDLERCRKIVSMPL